jgi:hypothetical protein
MELLVFVRNHGGPSGTSYVGASVGSAPIVEQPETREPVTSLAEFRIDADVLDPAMELRETLREAFGVMGELRHGRAIYYACSNSALKLLLEPGFDRREDIEADLAEMLALCSPRSTQRGRIGYVAPEAEPNDVAHERDDAAPSVSA